MEQIQLFLGIFVLPFLILIGAQTKEIQETRTLGFRRLILRNGLYVDKTMLIKEAVEYPRGVLAIFRPRRCGKSLNLDMIREFLRLDRDSSDVFRPSMRIMHEKHKLFRSQFMNKRPVIFMDLAEVGEMDSFGEAKRILHKKIVKVFNHFYYLNTSEKVGHLYRPAHADLTKRKTFDTVLEPLAVADLCHMIARHHGVTPVILIDEVDSPIAGATLYGYLNEITPLIFRFLSSTCKHNEDVETIVMTGVIPIGGPFMPSNVMSFSVFDDKFQTFFGFTERDIDDLLEECGINATSAFKKEIAEWYNHYHVGKTKIYNPAAVIEMAQKGWNLGPVSTPTGSLQQLTMHLLTKMGLLLPLQFEALITKNNGSLKKRVPLLPDFTTLLTRDEYVWSFFVHAGILDAYKEPEYANDYTTTLRVPGRDFQNMLSGVLNSTGLAEYTQFADRVQAGDEKKVIKIMADYIRRDGIYLFGERGNKDIHQLAQYITMVMSDWMDRFGANVTTTVDNRKVVLKFYEKGGNLRMQIGIQAFDGFWDRLKKALTLKKIITQVDNFFTVLEFFKRI